ncbi:MAG: ABC transporter ATP-binding protein [Planctomycetota bacterium]
MQDEHQDDDIPRGPARELWRRLYRFALAWPRHLRRVVVFALAVAVADMSFPLVSKYLVDALTAWQTGEAEKPSLWPYALAYLGLTLMLCVSVFGFIRNVGFLKTAMAADIRSQGFARLQRLEFAFFDRRATGWLMSRLTSDCERLANIMAWGTLDMLWASTFLVGIASVLLWLHWKLGLLVLTVVPLLAWASRAFQKRLLTASRRIRKINSAITADYNETIMGVVTTKSFSQEDTHLGQFAVKAAEMRHETVRNAMLSALYLPTVLSIGSVAAAFVMYKGGLDVTRYGLSLGTLVAFLSYTRQMFEPLQQLAHIFGEMQMARASGERILDLLGRPAAIVDSEEVLAAKARAAAAPIDGRADDGLPSRLGRIEYDGVGFAYDSGQASQAKVLHDIDLVVEPGQMVALVGSTGGGKTTLVSLLARFYEATEGEIRFDGVPQKQRSLSWLQSRLGVVLQDPYLFRGSIADNIRYGRLDADPADIERVAALVGATGFIERLEGGFQFDVGEGGTRLSQGERQLISFARALLKDPEVLIMDEATANVDSETERLIQQGLETVLDGRTSFVIAHRLSTIERADVIVVIEAGRIVEQTSAS